MRKQRQISLPFPVLLSLFPFVISFPLLRISFSCEETGKASDRWLSDRAGATIVWSHSNATTSLSLSLPLSPSPFCFFVLEENPPPGFSSFFYAFSICEMLHEFSVTMITDDLPVRSV